MKKLRKLLMVFTFAIVIVLPFALVGCFDFDFFDDDIFENPQTLHQDGEDLKSDLFPVEVEESYAFKLTVGEGKQYNSFKVFSHNSEGGLEDVMIGGAGESDEQEESNQYTIAVFDNDEDEIEFDSFNSTTGYLYQDSTVFVMSEGETYYVVITIVKTLGEEYPTFNLTVSYFEE